MRGHNFVLLYVLLLQLIFEGHGAAQIKHVVVVMEENHSFDHFFGWLPGVNGLNGKEYNPLSTKQANSAHIVVDKAGLEVPQCDPDHGTPATESKVFGAAAVARKDFTNASMVGFVEWEDQRGQAKTKYCGVMNMLTPEAHIPVLTSLGSEFAIMDRFFCSHPGPTWPNRIFMLSATSAGCTSTGAFYHDKVGELYPQKTIFDQLSSEGLTWKNYYNDTPWELFMESIAKHPENHAKMDQFYTDAREGKLPSFAWINPRAGINTTTHQGSNDQHPDHDIALGEAYYKDIYEALRASPQWNETLFIITYDEHGGFYDHVPTPLHVPPPGDGEASYPDKGFMFDRLGIRIPTILISPWIPKGTVISAPPAAQKPANNSEYELTSIMATTRKLLGMKSGPLTKRDAWAATFEQVLSLPQPRTDCPLHTPPAPPPAIGPDTEALQPVNELQHHIMETHAHLAGVPFPSHITQQSDVSEWLQKQYHRYAERAMQKNKLAHAA